MICEHCKGTGIVTRQYIEGRSMDFDCGACAGTGRIDEVSFSLAEAHTIKRCLKNFDLDGIDEETLRSEAEFDSLDNIDSFVARCNQLGIGSAD